MNDKIRIRMRETVRSDFPFAPAGTILYAGEEYNAITNKHGAVSGICKNGADLGVKPGEFDFIEAPEWLLKIHNKDGDGE